MPCTRPNQRKAALARGDRRPSIGLSSDVKSTFHFGIERIYPAQTARSRRTDQPIRVHATRPAIVATRCAELAELADATVSKTVVRKDVWVRVPHSALAPGCPLLAESACGGRSLFLLGVQPPGPARRGFAPRTPRDAWLRQEGIKRFRSGHLPQGSSSTPLRIERAVFPLWVSPRCVVASGRDMGAYECALDLSKMPPSRQVCVASPYRFGGRPDVTVDGAFCS